MSGFVGLLAVYLVVSILPALRLPPTIREITIGLNLLVAVIAVAGYLSRHPGDHWPPGWGP